MLKKLNGSMAPGCIRNKTITLVTTMIMLLYPDTVRTVYSDIFRHIRDMQEYSAMFIRIETY